MREAFTVPDESAFRPGPGVTGVIAERVRTTPVLPEYVIADLGSGWYTILKGEIPEESGPRIWKPYISHLGAEAAKVVVQSLNEAAARGAL